MASTWLPYGEEDTVIPKSARYDPSGLLGSKSFINIVIGARTMGKTYAFMKQGVSSYLKDGSQWIYLRRYDTEIKSILTLGDFFGPLRLNDEFPGIVLRVKGRLMQLRRAPKEPWENFGAFVALSAAKNYKSANLPHVTMIFYDEFIAESGVGAQYLSGEPDRLLGFWETVDRRLNKTRIYMAANAADLVNPYFVEWGLQLPTLGKTKTYRHNEGTITIQYADSAKFREASRQTAIGRFTAGSSYENYALENKFAQDTNTFIAPKTPESRFRCELRFHGHNFGVWYDLQEGDWYICRKIADDPDREIFTLLRRDMRPNTILLDRADPLLKTLKRAVMQGYCYFDSVRTREIFLESMALLGLR